MKRSSGILLPVSSLPSPYGIGTFGKEGYRFVDFLVSSGQTYWQILPLTPTGYGDSPYQSFSSFAGNPYFIDLDCLIEKGLLSKEEVLGRNWNTCKEYVDYGIIYANRFSILKKAYQKFQKLEDVVLKEAFLSFQKEEESWLKDYSLFMACKDHFEGVSWHFWPKEIKFRETKAMEKLENQLKEEIAFWSFLQFLFFEQWSQLKNYANESGIQIIGDLPIYVADDSADVWSHPELFEVDEELELIHVAGCPPDDFSPTGQLWGNPIYRWDVMKKEGYSWWMERLQAATKFYDVIRLDHFRGFEKYYIIDSKAETAMVGEWVKGPGMDFFYHMKKAIGEYPVIAEDLGFLTASVRKLLWKTRFPGMKVLEFAFDASGKSDYLPHNYNKNSVVYTGTHDNETLLGWYQNLEEKDRKFCCSYLGVTEKKSEKVVWEIIRLAFSSVSNLSIVPMQDYLMIDNAGRMNHPSIMEGNWKWRCRKKDFSKKLSKKIKKMTKLYGRLDEKKEGMEQEDRDIEEVLE